MNDRIKESQLRLVAWNMGPYGWRARAGPDGKIFFVAEPTEQLCLRYMKLLREFGSSFEEIALQLNEDGIPAMCGSSWTASVVKELLNRDDSELCRSCLAVSKKIQAG